MQDQGHSRSRSSNVNVIEGQDYLRPWPLKVKVIQVQGQSRSSHSQGHFKVILISGQGHSGIKW